MLQNAHFLAKIGADTAENEQHFAEILPKTGGPEAPLGLGTARGEVAEVPRVLVRDQELRLLGGGFFDRRHVPGLAFQIWGNSNSKFRRFDFKFPKF